MNGNLAKPGKLPVQLGDSTTPAITQINPQQQPHRPTATLYFAHVCKTFEPVVHFGYVFSS